MAFSDTKQPGDLITASDYNDLVDDLFTRIKGNNINKATADISANLPVPGEGDKILIETDTGRTLYDNGSEFVEVGLSESQINLSDLGSKSHSDLTDITSDDHHTKTTDLDDLNDVTGVTAFEENSSGNLPSPGTEGRIFFETDTGRTLYDNGSTFVEIGLSESEIKLGDVGNLDAGQKKITNLADPTDARDAVNKQFVDSSQAGLEVKESTRVATAGISIDLTSTSNPNPIDGVNLDDGDRVLLKDQTDATENGIYDAVNATDPTTWVRSNDFNEDSEVAAGAFVFVEEGGDNKNEGYVVKTNDPITLGTTAIEWTQFSGLGQVVAGNGIEKSGDTLNVRMPLEDDATQVTTVSAIDFGGDDFLVTDDTDNTATVQLSNDSVSIAGNSVSLGGSTSVDYVDLNDTGASFPITNADIANSSVSVAGNSVNLGGSTTVQYVDLNDTGASFPIPNSDLANSSVSVAGNSVSLGGSTTVDYVDLSDTGTSFPIPNTDLSNSSVSVAGNNVALGGSTAVNHSDLSNIGAGDHHTRYSDEEAQDAVGGILNTDFSYDDAGNNISLASNSLTVANTSIALGGTGTPEVDNFNGNNGNSGQFLQTDGSSLSFTEVDTSNSTTYKGNDIDSDGDGIVDKADDSNLLQGNPPPLVRQSTEPSNPDDGLLWYDLSTGQLKKFKNNSFEAVNKQLSNKVFGIFDTGVGDWNKNISDASGGSSITTQTENIGQTFSDDVVKIFANGGTTSGSSNSTKDDIRLERTFDFSKFKELQLRVDFNTNQTVFTSGNGFSRSANSKITVKVNGQTQLSKGGGSSGQATITVDLTNTQTTGKITLQALGGANNVAGQGGTASSTLKAGSILLRGAKQTVAGSGAGGNDSDL